MPHSDKTDQDNIRQFVKRRINGLALTEKAADALEESQNAEDLSATDVINRALQVYNDLRRYRDKGLVFIKDEGDDTFSSYSWK